LKENPNSTVQGPSLLTKTTNWKFIKIKYSSTVHDDANIIELETSNKEVAMLDRAQPVTFYFLRVQNFQLGISLSYTIL
jgi:hypothetical protein